MKKLTYVYKKLIFNLKKKIDLDKIVINNLSLNKLFNFFSTDKGTSVKNPYNKKKNNIVGHGFAKFYEKYFSKLKKTKINLLEIGTWEGASLAAFSKYFTNGNIFGIDRNFKFKYKSKNINFINCDTREKKNLYTLRKKFKNIKFKIIIDDSSHLLSDMIYNLKFFFNYLDKNGYYIIEDYNHPEYFAYLNDSSNKELTIKEIKKKIKKKNFFRSKILNKNFQSKLFTNIQQINVHKGNYISDGKNISDIVFFKKK